MDDELELGTAAPDESSAEEQASSADAARSCSEVVGSHERVSLEALLLSYA